jgi:hypothetical protein
LIRHSNFVIRISGAVGIFFVLGYHPHMRWLLHGPMTSAVADALVRHGHTAQNMTELGLPPASDPAVVLQTANAAQLDILTTDATLTSAVFLVDVWMKRSMVYLQLEGADVEQDDAVDRLFERYKRLTPGRLYTVTGSRVKVRQLPGKQ